MLEPWRVVIAVGFVVLLAWGNLRGVRESGRLFSLPTYLFLGAYFLVIGWGGWAVGTGCMWSYRWRHPRPANRSAPALPVSCATPLNRSTSCTT